MEPTTSVSIPYATSRATTNFTLECWFKPAQVDKAQAMLETADGFGNYGIQIALAGDLSTSQPSPGSLYFNCRSIDAGVATDHIMQSHAGLVQVDQWQHLAVTYDSISGHGKMFYNGRLIKETTLGSFVPMINYPLYLGRHAVSTAPGIFSWIYGGD